ncbi:peptidase domain-containing ABC transporter [Stenotrophomonas sp. TWI143]|jgi:ATP-binding cassette subfamily B protein RaxB|uniref:peptidase domain-containing ABC transporter n=2 Tax=Lysobacteraceae TaxID=32033 RepID=UPI0013DB7C66|nr:MULTISPECIES: peptidase domain-containing ABC transporter [Stenotrophomonas]MBE5271624.1 peptidase domain-containing ABC transporter [Stenotrophomonas sp. B2]MBH1814776.1 peptidase domain-containing ABC transporter [Stenotrophomonas maltophilia]MBH1823272.1 peptidase domain-containing ABC transporter [Stenotrophomonas maltophilia]MBH1837207.1 peptidase domain-containing ABC transporter [Stenotrophomonas maltophilia]MCU1090434.1 peptidase domain-containing ABC transporter [Stenotrophomonas m
MFNKRYWRVQSEVSECGLACLAICSSMLGADLEMSELRRKYHNSQRGVDLNQLIALASALDMQCRPVRCEPSDLQHLGTPAILHWKLNHFVVLEKVSRGRYHIIDPAHGSLSFSEAELSQAFTGIAVEVSSSPSFRPRKQRSPLNIWSMIRFKGGVGTALFHTLVYTLLLQGFVLLSPFFMQLAVDEGVLRGDRGFLMALALGFGAVAVFNSLAEALRGVTLQRASALMGWDMSRRLFHHLVSLPLTWFHRRRLADALSRMESIDPIRQLIANGLIGALLDGVLALGIIVLMFVYSPLMSLVALTALGLYVLMRVAAIPMSMKMGMASLQANIAERGTRIETLRAMQSIKTMGGEFSRESIWANKYADLVRASLNSANLQIGIGAGRTLLDGLSLVAIVYIGAQAVLANTLTVGALYAFVAYRQQLSNRLTTLVDQCIAWRLTELHSDRIADIALSPSEEGFSKDPSASDSMEGHIQLRSVYFQYSAQEAPALKDINLAIAPGEFVAITGPSGCGKSTLVKVLTGLYPPSAGELLYDGLNIASWGPRVVRQRMGVVMQDDELLTGSIVENVTFFAERPDIALVWQCLEMAAVKEDVQRMPMQLETLVGDMGSTLSGGQKQRLLLARALYRKPSILVLDEATANLDVARESRIYQALAQLDITRILITHRPDTMRLADRLVRIDQGRVVGDTRKPTAAAPTAAPTVNLIPAVVSPPAAVPAASPAANASPEPDRL